MVLRDYLDILRRRWLTLVSTALLVIAATTAITLVMPEKYTATTRLFFSVEGTASVTDLAQGSTFAEKQITSYAQIVSSPIVLQPVINDLRLDRSPADLAEAIQTTVPTDTVILDVSVVDSSATQSAAIANAVATELTRVVSELSPERNGGDQAVKATVVKPAAVPTLPSSPNVVRNLALGGILAIILGLGAALLRDALDTKVRSDADLKSITDAPILGSIAFDESVPAHPVVVADDPLSAPSEAVRRLRTNLQFIGTAGHAKKVVISSSVAGEGKTTTSINLAVALADAGVRVALVDADLRRPSIAEYMGLEGSVGLTTVLIGRAELQDVIQPWRSTGLDILPSGQVPPNPSELLGSPAMRLLLEQLEATYDVVLLDTPPLLPVTDGTILTKLAGGALIVVGADRIHRRQLEESLTTLTTANAHLHGLVLNKVAKRDAQPYAYGGGYYRTEATTSKATSTPGGAGSSADTTGGDSVHSSGDTTDVRDAELGVGGLPR